MAKKSRLRSELVGKRNTSDAARTSQEELMEATVAACALIAFADGRLDARERRSLFTLFQTSAFFTRFSHADIQAEFQRHENAFSEDAGAARHEALVSLRSFPANAASARLILSACKEILEADGVEHPNEAAEMDEISTVLCSKLTGGLDSGAPKGIIQ